MDEAGQASTDNRSSNPVGCVERRNLMNSKLQLFVYPAIAALALAAAVAAHAESPTVDDTATQAWSQTKTRDQVTADGVEQRPRRAGAKRMQRGIAETLCAQLDAVVVERDPADRGEGIVCRRLRDGDEELHS